ncbi:MAG TPA: hypothetical protein VJV78_46505 [Polyangiales bacterium]|nr:hypothetical protein [Polyangiales bacterium]
MELFDVHVLGFEVSEERATRALMRVFGLSEASARIFVHSVPRVGKRRVPKPTAERYIRALHAVGAIVECRLCAPSSSEGSGVASLPSPAISSFPGTAVPHIMQDSFGVMAPVAYSPHMPTIPKAPRVPADLHAIRARKGPDSLAPHWRPTDGPDPRKASSPRAPAATTATADSGRRLDFAAGGGLAADGELQSPNPDALILGPDVRPGLTSPTVNLEEPSANPSATAEAAEGAVFDSDGQLSSPRPSPAPPIDPELPWYAQPTHQLIMAAVVIGSVTLAATSGMFETDSSRLSRAFEQAGIEAGQYDRARAFLRASDTALEGTNKADLTRLVEGLLSAGATEAWLTRIERKGGVRTSHQLLLQLPEDPKKRKDVFAAYAKLLPPSRQGAEDRGQPFLSIVF